MHVVRAFPTSVAFFKQVSFQQILQAGSWRTHNTFTSVYLKDMALTADGVMSLPTFVAAQTIVPGTSAP